MSMRHYTVKMLKDLIKDLPDDMYVVTRTFEENWTSEGMFDGIRPYITEKLWEIRTGFIPSDDQPCSYGEVLILSDFDDEDNLERWNNHVEGLKLDELKVNGFNSETVCKCDCGSTKINITVKDKPFCFLCGKDL